MAMMKRDAGGGAKEPEKSFSASQYFGVAPRKLRRPFWRIKRRNGGGVTLSEMMAAHESKSERRWRLAEGRKTAGMTVESQSA